MKKSLKPTTLFMTVALAAAALVVSNALSAALDWNTKEQQAIRNLWVGSLGERAEDPTNPVAENPDAVDMGHQLFFDKRFSSNGEVSCANCHNPDSGFTDGEQLAEGVGQAGRNTPTIIGTAFQKTWFLDGRADTMWAQALGPLENPQEHGGNRMQYVKLIARHYKAPYEALFGPLPDFSDRARFPDNAMPSDGPLGQAWNKMKAADRNAATKVFVNMGRAIAAYERQLNPGPSRFDTYARGVLTGSMDDQTLETILTPDEREGLRLFVGKAGCAECHSGSLLSDGEFHNTGVAVNPKVPNELGRAQGIQDWVQSEFNCLGAFGAPESATCQATKQAFENSLGNISFESSSSAAASDTTMRAFKTPTLRNIAQTAPYMHAGQLRRLSDVIEHYNSAPAAPQGKSELKPLRLTNTEKFQLESFLRTLSSSVNAPKKLLSAPER
jgi:cytochrome c peroxidase